MKYTKYEKARIIGSRALQLSMGASFMLKLEDKDLQKLRYSTIEIAKLEFEKGVIPLTIKRSFPKARVSKKRSDIHNKETIITLKE